MASLMRLFALISAATLMSVSAHAAVWEVGVKDSGETFISMTGSTQSWDPTVFDLVIEEAKTVTYDHSAEVCDTVGDTTTCKWVTTELTRPFSGELHLEGPGGDGGAMYQLIWRVNHHKLNTIAAGDCFSACAMVWLAGQERTLEDNAVAGFHMATIYDTSGLNEWKDLEGWLGVQDGLNSSAAYFFTVLAWIGVDNPVNFYHGIHLDGAHDEFFRINNENIWIVGESR